MSEQPEAKVRMKCRVEGCERDTYAGTTVCRYHDLQMPLWDWIESNYPDLLDRFLRLHEQGKA